MASGPSPRSAMEIELTKLSSPRIFLVRMLVFLMLCALIGLVLLIGTILAFRQVIRLYPEVSWVNNFRIADPGLAIARHPTLDRKSVV